MDSFGENLLLVAASVLTIGLILKKKRSSRKTIRSCWVNPYLRQRNTKGRFAEDFDDMRAWNNEFAQNFHMEQEQFEELFQKVKHRLKPKRCTRPDGISTKQRLAYTLEYLTGGPFFERYAASNYRISKASSCNIVKETCQILYEELAKTEFMAYTKENWLAVADDFKKKWNMPNCLGSLDGKHVRIKCPANAGSLYYNYKLFLVHSITMHSSLRWLLVATIVCCTRHLAQAGIYTSKYVTKDIAHDISYGLYNLARDLSVQLQDKTSKSEIISPLSIGSSMLLLLRTAKGSTRQELLQLMGLTKYQENNPKIPRNFAHLMNELLFDNVTEKSALDYNVPWKSQSKCEVTDYHYDGEDSDYDYDRFDNLPEDPSLKNVVKLANAIFVQDGLYNNSRLNRLVDKYYRSRVESLDFHSNPGEAKNHINKWADKNTNGRIREIISDDLSTETTMVVANALYFKAFWEDVFLAGATKMRKFFPNGENEESVEAEIMAHGGCFPYYKSSELDARIMGFPYKNRTTTMYIILPNSSTRVKLQHLMEKLDAATMDDLISNMTMQTASVLFPKMHLTTSFELKSALQSLGTKSMFVRGQSNFSLLNPAETNETRSSLSVSGVLHKVDLAIDESGTEGAAVTATLLDRSMPTVNFRAIVPFLLAIRHDATKLLLFYGPVYDPSA